MAKEIVIQPNGKYALWSTVVDHFTNIDMTREELENVLMEHQRVSIQEFIVRQIVHPTRTIKDSLKDVEFRHGKKDRKEIEEYFQNIDGNVSSKEL